VHWECQCRGGSPGLYYLGAYLWQERKRTKNPMVRHAAMYEKAWRSVDQTVVHKYLR